MPKLRFEDTIPVTDDDLLDYGLEKKTIKRLLKEGVVFILYMDDRGDFNLEIEMVLPKDITPEQAAMYGVQFGVNVANEDHSMWSVETRTEDGQVILWGVVEPWDKEDDLEDEDEDE